MSADPAEAVKWFRRSAEQGNPAAQHDLGLCYADAIGVARDQEQALKWFRLAAEQGYAKTQLYLANVLELRGEWNEAAVWYGRAARQGLARAQFGFAKPPHRLFWVFLDAHAVTIANSEFELRLRQTQRRRFGQPLRPLHDVRRRPMPIHERKPEGIYRRGIALSRGSAKPSHGCLGIQFHPITIVVTGTHIVLSRGISRFSLGLELLKTRSSSRRWREWFQRI